MRSYLLTISTLTLLTLLALSALTVIIPLYIQLLATLALSAVLWLICLRPPTVYETPLLPPGAKGLALPGLIFLTPGLREPERTRVLRHEHEHQRQMRRYSPLGVALFLGWHYLGGALWARLRGRRVSFMELYNANPLERQAMAVMEDEGYLLRVRDRAPR